MRTILEDFQLLSIAFSFKHLVCRLANCRSREAPPDLRVSTNIPSRPDAFPFGIRFTACLTSLRVASAISGCGTAWWLSLWLFDACNSLNNSSIGSKIRSWSVIVSPDLLRTQPILFL